MKRSLFFLLVIGMTGLNQAQDISDALLYSASDILGTARYNALGGSFSALGGDLSAIGTNPAASAVFMYNTTAFTFVFDEVKNDATYFGTTARSSESDFDISQAGATFIVYGNPGTKGVQKVTIGFNYNMMANHDNRLFFNGNGDSTVADLFLNAAQGIPLQDLELQQGETISFLYGYLGNTQGTRAQNAFLGYQGYIIDPVEDSSNNTQYVSNVASGRFNQSYEKITRGYNGKYSFNASMQVNDRFYLGLNLNSDIIDYWETSFLNETNSNNGSSVSRIGFENTLSSRGYGFSAQFGAIVKLTNSLRMGLSYDTPTWYNIYEETTQYLATTRQENGSSISAVVNPAIINIFPRYDFNSPGRFGAGLAYVFGQSGLLSFDYSYRDYSNMKFKPEYDASFSNLNSAISSTMQGASTFRLGGEYRFKGLSFRGGYVYEDSPYKDDSLMSARNTYSFGLGYSFGTYYFDATYSWADRDRMEQLYNTGLTDSALVSTRDQHFMFTLGFNL